MARGGGMGYSPAEEQVSQGIDPGEKRGRGATRYEPGGVGRAGRFRGEAASWASGDGGREARSDGEWRFTRKEKERGRAACLNKGGGRVRGEPHFWGREEVEGERERERANLA